MTTARRVSLFEDERLNVFGSTARKNGHAGV